MRQVNSKGIAYPLQPLHKAFSRGFDWETSSPQSSKQCLLLSLLEHSLIFCRSNTLLISFISYNCGLFHSQICKTSFYHNNLTGVVLNFTLIFKVIQYEVAYWRCRVENRIDKNKEVKQLLKRAGQQSTSNNLDKVSPSVYLRKINANIKNNIIWLHK